MVEGSKFMKIFMYTYLSESRCYIRMKFSPTLALVMRPVKLDVKRSKQYISATTSFLYPTPNQLTWKHSGLPSGLPDFPVFFSHRKSDSCRRRYKRENTWDTNLRTSDEWSPLETKIPMRVWPGCCFRRAFSRSVSPLAIMLMLVLRINMPLIRSFPYGPHLKHDQSYLRVSECEEGKNSEGVSYDVPDPLEQLLRYSHLPRGFTTGYRYPIIVPSGGTPTSPRTNPYI